MDQQILDIQRQIQDLTTQIEALSINIRSIQEFVDLRKEQQLFSPVDDVSRAALGAWTGDSTATITLTQNINVAAVPQIITVPKAFDGVRVVNIGGATYNIPYYL